MNNSFAKWDKEFKNQNLYAFNNNSTGLLWLKIRAICRGKQIQKFIDENKITLKSVKLTDRNIELFDILVKKENAMSMLDKFLQDMNNEWYAAFGVDIDKLKQDLYNIQYYSWGGDQNNSLDKYFISRYVKPISDFSTLQNKQAEIGTNAWNYVQNSWYNNWTSFIIESLFKRNPKVISAVGEIKSVDFFIKDYPLDLKVTFFPNTFMEEKIKKALGKNTLPWLKSECKKLGIKVDSSLAPNLQIYTLSEKLKETGHTEILDKLESTRRKIINDAKKNPVDLMQWLYENQGTMRFGAENRLYLILADTKDFDQSWKLKRSFLLMEPIISDYILNFTKKSLKTINFNYNKINYKALADAIFIIK